MAKITIVGATFRKTSYCPQCRKLVPPSGRKKNGIKCPRCGVFTWADYKKYPAFDSIPEPVDDSTEQIESVLLKREKSAKKGKIELDDKKGDESDKGGMASRPQLERSANRRSGEDKPPSSKSGTKKSSGKGTKSSKPKGKKPANKPGLGNNK